MNSEKRGLVGRDDCPRNFLWDAVFDLMRLKKEAALYRSEGGEAFAVEGLRVCQASMQKTKVMMKS